MAILNSLDCLFSIIKNLHVLQICKKNFYMQTTSWIGPLSCYALSMFFQSLPFTVSSIWDSVLFIWISLFLIFGGMRAWIWFVLDFQNILWDISRKCFFQVTFESFSLFCDYIIENLKVGTQGIFLITYPQKRI